MGTSGVPCAGQPHLSPPRVGWPFRVLHSCRTASRVSRSVASMRLRGTRSARGLIGQRSVKGIPRLMAIISISAYTPPSRCSSRVIVTVRQM